MNRAAISRALLGDACEVSQPSCKDGSRNCSRIVLLWVRSRHATEADDRWMMVLVR